MMLKRLLIYIGVILFATSCYKFNNPEKPKNLISEDKMIDILIDIRLISSANGANKSVLISRGILEKNYIYKKHNIDSLQFASSNSYYAYYIEDYEAIYAKVKDSLEVLKEEYDELVEQDAYEKRVRDSINNVKRQNKPLKKDPIRVERDSIKRALKKRGLIEPISDSENETPPK